MEDMQVVGEKAFTILVPAEAFSPITKVIELPKYTTVVQTAPILALLKKLCMSRMKPNRL
jgi:hypothetical protein